MTGKVLIAAFVIGSYSEIAAESETPIMEPSGDQLCFVRAQSEADRNQRQQMPQYRDHLQPHALKGAATINYLQIVFRTCHSLQGAISPRARA
jgi:hypothetical protein